MENILQEYDKKNRAFISFSNSLKSLIESFLINAKIDVHTISARVKERTSLEDKILSKGTYACLSEITDVIGVRIITHYADDVDKIAKVIEREFLIDKENSIDKRATLDPDRFGYLSLHYIVGLKKDRLSLAEYSHFKNLKAEIQIRSILQHTWAEIEHDTGYKSNTGVPNEIRRKFSRLAGLLEIADDEFIQIKRSLERHKAKIERDLKKGTANIPLDRISLVEFINTNPIISNIAERIKEKTGFYFSEKATEENLTTSLSILQHLGVDNLKQLDDLLNNNIEGIINRFIFISNKISKGDKSIPRQHIASYLTQVIFLKDGSKEKIQEYIAVLKANKIYPPATLADNLYKTYEQYFKLEKDQKKT